MSVTESTEASSTGAAQPSRVESLAAAALLVSVVALAGETAIYAVYSPDGLVRLVVFAAVALLAVAFGGARCRPPGWALAVSAFVTVRALGLTPPLDNVVSDDRLLTAVVVVAAASAAPAVLPLVKAVRAAQVAAAALGVAAAGYGLVLLSSQPIIDVFELLQGAGRGLLDGQNPYTLSFPAAPDGQVDACFTYLPATALLAAPAVGLFADARWASLGMLVAAGAVLLWQARDRGGVRLGLAALAVVLPGTGLVMQQAWTEPLFLAPLVGAAVLADRGRFTWAAVLFGMALATKQHVVLLVPLLALLPMAGSSWPRRLGDAGVAAGVAAALTLPWLLANPSRFTECTVDFFLDTPAPSTSLSLWLHLPEPARLPLLVLALAAGYLLVWWRCPRSGGGFLIAAGVVFTTFGLVNKQTFVNQWWLVAALVVAGLTVVGHRRRS